MGGDLDRTQSPEQVFVVVQGKPGVKNSELRQKTHPASSTIDHPADLARQAAVAAPARFDQSPLLGAGVRQRAQPAQHQIANMRSDPFVVENEREIGKIGLAVEVPLHRKDLPDLRSAEQRLL